MSNQIEVYDKVNDMSSIQELGRAIALSGMFGCERVEQGVVFALQCMAERKPPLEMAKSYHLIKGKLSKRADAMLADFRRAGGKWVWEDLKNTDKQAAKVDFEGQTYSVAYTMAEAAKAGLVKAGGNWEKFPANMLRARLVSETLRAIAPEIVQGAYTPEEIENFDDLPKPATTSPRKPPSVDLGNAKKVELISAGPIRKMTDVEIDAEQLDGDHPRDRLKAILKPHAELVNLFLRSRGKISDEQTWEDAPLAILSSIESNTGEFLKAAGVDV
jgi:hypothetical protein